MELTAPLAGSGRLDEAIDLYRSALEASPELVEAHFNLGNALLDKGLPDRAAASFLEAVRRAPAHAEAHRNLAVAYGRIERPCDALSHLRKSADLNASFAAEATLQRAMATLESQCGTPSGNR